MFTFAEYKKAKNAEKDAVMNRVLLGNMLGQEFYQIWRNLDFEVQNKVLGALESGSKLWATKHIKDATGFHLLECAGIVDWIADNPTFEMGLWGDFSE